MKLLGHPWKTYKEVAVVNVKKTGKQSNSNFVTQPKQNRSYFEPADRTYWIMDELTYRYNVSRHKISSDFMERGLPYYKEGRGYRFPIDEVKKWEIKTKQIPYGRGKDMIELPAYSEYCKYLSDELSKAKQNKDKAREREIKLLAQQSEIHLDNSSFPTWFIFFILAVCALIAYCFFK